MGEHTADVQARIQVGDHIWVKETWAADHDDTGDSPRLIWRADLAARYFDDLGDGESVVWFGEGPHYLPSDWKPIGWCPSIVMPRWASRITLKANRVRVEPLHRISEADANAEGFTSIEAFLAHWDRLNFKRGYGQKRNPWVFVYTFEVIS